MTFVDITVVPVPSDRREQLQRFSERMAVVYRDHGATRIVDYWQTRDSAGQDGFHADGTSYDEGELRSIAQAVGANGSESVVVTVTEWPSREARDRGTAAATRDPRVLETLDEEPVFDGARLLGDCFEVSMDLRADSP